MQKRNSAWIGRRNVNSENQIEKIIIKPNINRRYFAMKFLKDLHKSMARHVEYLEETMAEYVGFHDRVRC